MIDIKVIEEVYSIYKEKGNIEIDSRKVNPGDIFIGIKGEKQDGGQFAESALKKGASIAILNDNHLVEKTEKVIIVSDTTLFLQKLAEHHRAQLLDLTVIAVVGSNGKTTTKELISRVLGTKYNTFSTPGNMNNHIGLPLTVLKIDNKISYAVLELGANHLGEHKLLCEIAQPQYGIITNCGKDHLEGYGSIENVIKANLELYDYLTLTKGSAFVNVEDNVLVDAASNLIKFYYGRSKPYLNKSRVLTASILEEFPFMSIEINFSTELSESNIYVNSHLFGNFQLFNLLAAASIGFHFDIDPQYIKNALESYIPENNRSQIVHWKNNTILLDAYNANPSSMTPMVKDFSRSTYEKKMVVLGDMLELGEASRDEHLNILNLVSELNFDLSIFVGEEFHRFAEEKDFVFFKNSSECKKYLIEKDFSDYTILAKGSRGIAIENCFAITNTKRNDLQSFSIPEYSREELMVWKTIPIVERGSSLIEISQLSDRIIVKPMYFESGIHGSVLNCYTRPEIAEKILKVSERLPDHLSLLVYDAWRPLSVQQSLFDLFKSRIKEENPNLSDFELLNETQKYVSLPSSNPSKPSPHFTGGSIDLTIFDTFTGRELDMGTSFDDFTEKANTRSLEKAQSVSNINVIENRRLLYHLMAQEGFANYAYEWWHFDYGNQWWAKHNNTVAIFGGIKP
jgi:UDP-N-acetylmuramoyl-tripeptide--D-alanyl-D-alanine ligase